MKKSSCPLSSKEKRLTSSLHRKYPVDSQCEHAYFHLQPDKTELVVILEGLSDPHVQITEVLINVVVESFEKVQMHFLSAKND